MAKGRYIDLIKVEIGIYELNLDDETKSSGELVQNMINLPAETKNNEDVENYKNSQIS